MKLRPYAPSDEAALMQMWHETRVHAYPYLPTEQAYTVADLTSYFCEHIAPKHDIWLAESDAKIVGLLAMQGSYLNLFYVHPTAQRAGVGEALLAKARELSPQAIELHTHQQNVSACAFYEKHGFRAARFGTSGPPESSPDVEYHWRATGNST